MEKPPGIREKAIEKARELRGRLRSSRNEPADGGMDTGSTELARNRHELLKTRRELTRRNRELAELRASVGEAEPRPASAAWLPEREGTAPFFILGPPKSGTSWLHGALDSHPEIFCSGEGKFFGRDLKTDNPYGQWGAEVSAAMTGLGYQTADRASLYSALMDSKDLNGWFRRNGGWTPTGEVESHTRVLVRLTLDYVFAEARARSGKRIVGDKTPSHIQYLEEIHEFYPDARILHIIRDGRDQATSSMFHWWRSAKDQGGFFPLSAEHRERRDAYHEDRAEFGADGRSIFDEASLRALAGNWRATVANTVENGPRLFPNRYLEVRYEELLLRPEELFAEMASFLGASPEEEPVEKMIEATSFERRTGNRARGTEDPASFLRKGIAGDWKNYFTRRDKKIYKEEAGDLLIELGYEKDEDW